MTHYQKLTTMILRIVAMVLLLLGLISGIIGLAISKLWTGAFGALLGLGYSLPATIFGIVLFGLSRATGRLVCYDLDLFSGA